ncbi:MAG TPA: ABC transporter permease [Terriglobia bacterium]|nr:ABC transporter permease [Terriglobia bacterium]
MSFHVKVRSFLRNLFLSRRVETDLDQEVHSHLEMLIEENFRAGMDPDQAQRAARIEMGGVDQVKEQVRDARTGAFLDSLLQGLRFSLRKLRKSPGFTAVVVVTLALGIGANTAIFSVVEGVLLKPLPYPKPEELVAVWLTAAGLNIRDLNPSPADYIISREQNRTFQDIGLYKGYSVNITGLAEPEHASGLQVTDGLLPVLGVIPILGRSFTRTDDSPGSFETVMLTYGYWQRKFGGDRSVIGKTITVDGSLRQIIGVLPWDFRFAGPDLAILLPLKLDRTKLFLGNFSYQAIARLKPGVTVAEANADVARMIPIMLRSFPPPPGYSRKMFQDGRIGPNLRTLKQDVVGDVGKVLWVLMGGIGLVLLIACANVANLLQVRAEGRQQEMAIRAALGATRGRIAGEMLFESFILALLGSVLGLGLAYAGLRALVASAPTGLPRLNEIGIDGTMVLFTLAVSLVASLLFGSIPILKYAGRRLGTGLREGGRSMSESRERHRSRSVLVVVQVALALVLLISSGLMIRTFRALTRVDPGFVAPSEVQIFRVDIPDTAVKEAERVVRTQEEILHKIEAVPGVSSVAISMSVPMDGNGWYDPVLVKDHSYAPGEIPLHRYRFVAPGYFKTLGTRLVAGRDLTWSDIYNKVPVAIVSEKLARENWHDPSDALGKQIRSNTKDDWRTVVGVVGDVHEDGMDKEASNSVYWPILEARSESNDIDVRRYVTFSIRSPRAGSESLVNEVRRAVWSVDPNLPLADIRTLDYYYKRSMARTSFTLLMLAVAGGMALLLGVVGLYGVIAYSVSQRRREIGIRMALGAEHQDLVAMFVRHALGLTGIGVACGLLAALALMRLMSSLLFGVKPFDAVTYGTVSLGLIATAALSSYLPARRAAAVNPIESLRAE